MTRRRRSRSAAEKLFAQEWRARSVNYSKGQKTDLEQMLSDFSQTLKLDAFVISRRDQLHARWDSHPQITAVVRRILDVAVMSGVDAHERRIPEVLSPDFKEGAKHADRALKAMELLLNWMSGRDAANKGRWRKNDAAEALIGVLKFASDVDWRTDPVQRLELISRRAGILLEAKEAIDGLSKGLQANGQALAGQNIGEPEKLAFVSVLRDGWLSLFQKPPGVADQNFGFFVLSAWEDIGGMGFESATDPETFTHAIRTSVEEIPDPWSLPTWLF